MLATQDDCWGWSRAANGSYQWDPERFPSGIPALAAYVESRGFHLGESPGLYM
jgi:alpha-galactosidase